MGGARAGMHRRQVCRDLLVCVWVCSSGWDGRHCSGCEWESVVSGGAGATAGAVVWQ